MDIKQLAAVVSKAKLVGIGESSHGTHEFFTNKVELFVELVNNYGFNTFMLEDNPEVCEKLNEYIRTGRGNLRKLITNFYAVWRINELAELIDWLKDNYSKFGVELVGFDINQSKVNASKRDELMARNIIESITYKPQRKTLVWAHNAHIKTSSEDEDFQPMGLFLKQNFGQDYISVGQFFGAGEFNAAHIDEKHPDDTNRNLQATKVNYLPEELLESRLSKLCKKTHYFSRSELIAKGLDNTYLARSLGWGLVPHRIDEYVQKCNPVKEFDILIYCPKTTPSHIL